jgi:signal transduction histidine kinase
VTRWRDGGMTMATVELALSAVVPLVVALLNLLVAGYALTAGLRAAEGRARTVAFAAGPAGVGVWALAWFVATFDPAALDGARLAGWLGAVLGVLGLLVDALAGHRSSPPRAARARSPWNSPTGFASHRSRMARYAPSSSDRSTESRSADRMGYFSDGLPGPLPGRWRVGVGAAVLGGAGALTGAVAAAGFAPEGPWAGLFGRALALVGLLGVAVVRLLAPGASQDRRLRRRTLAALLAPGVGYVALAAAAFLRGRVAVDVLLFTVLAVELLTWVEILEGRVRVEVLLPRAVAYLALAVVVAGLAAWVYARLGYPLDPVAVAVTVALALFAAALFMGLSDPLTRRVEGALFPEHARTRRALEASQGELSALRRRLERVERLAIAGELAASVAHEIKNPLAPIRGYAQMLEGRMGAVEPAEQALFAKGLRIIREEVDRIDGRVAELLDLARVGAEAPDLDAAFALEEVVRDAVAVAQAEPGARDVQVFLQGELGRVQGDADAVRGALLNLLKNAAEAMAEGGGGRVEVRVTLEGELAVVRILDEGPGLGAQDPERVFQTFYTTKAGGTGLGLAIARSAIQAAGGTLSLGERADRRGAEAQVRLTRVRSEEVEA